ncbi:MAG: hypothetical protein M1820_005690 [Bogoriella megaspora]|nr:MAG: hypothetical protein M1820_005690 [Bogoriella megaspora]
MANSSHPSGLWRWYSDSSPDLSAANLITPAQKAFEDGVDIFEKSFSKDSKKRQRIEQLKASNIHDVLDAVLAARMRYEGQRRDSKTRQCLTAFSERVHHYSNVMDVMVQQHPEYVSLAWGAMKLLFGVCGFSELAVVEHETVCRTIVTALNDIADCLPRVEVAAAIYPTKSIQQAVVILYARIVRFLIRALEWYEESKFSHALHSITRPASLRYNDLITDIKRETQNITKNAAASSQAEQRDMHDEIREIRNLVTDRTRSEQVEVLSKLSSLGDTVAQLRDEITSDRAINASARLEFRFQLADIQLTQALSFVAAHCNIDHTSKLRTAIALRDRYRFSNRSRTTCFWMAPKMQDWNKSVVSSTVLLRATYRQRPDVRDFYADVIEQLIENRAVTLWILRDRSAEYPLLEVFKSLILQALSLDYSSHTDLAFSFQLRKFLDARTDEDCLNILSDLLQHFKMVYVLVDASAMCRDTAARCQVHLLELSQKLSLRGARTVVKVIASWYGPLQEYLHHATPHVVLEVGKGSKKAQKRKMKQRDRLARHDLGSLIRLRDVGS